MSAGGAFGGVQDPKVRSATTPLRSGHLNPNGGVKTLATLQERHRWLMPLLLWLLTLMLWLPGLGNLPLRDWDELA